MEVVQQATQARAAIVTGAGNGLGLAIARKFAASDSRVLLVDRDPVVRDHIGQDDLPEGVAFALVQELAAREAARAIFEQAFSLLGRVDTLINNAAWSLHRALLDTTPEEFDQLVAVNQRAPFFLPQQFLKSVHRSPNKPKDPVIVNIASVNALAGNPNLVTYAGTKGALVAMTRAMAVEMVGEI